MFSLAFGVTLTISHNLYSVKRMMFFLLAAWSMPAAVGCVLRSIIGLAAAGITEF
jgi:hypothetical protein